MYSRFIIKRKLVLFSLFICFIPFFLQAQRNPEKETAQKTKNTLTQAEKNSESEEKKSSKETTDKESTPENPAAGTDSNFELLRKELNADNNKSDAAGADQPSWAWQIIKTTFSLAFILFIFWIAFRVIQFRRRLPKNESTIIRTLHQVPLQPGKNLQLVEFNSKLLLLGVSDAGIQLISEVKEAPLVDQIKIECERISGGQTKADFLSELTNVIKDKIVGGAKKKMSGDDRAQRQAEKDFTSSFAELERSSRDVSLSKPEGAEDDWEKMRSLAKSKLGSLKQSKADFRQDKLEDDLFK